MQTFFISTQFFYKHYFDSPGDLILPVPYRNIAVPRSVPIAGTGCGPGGRRLAGKPCKLQPRFFSLNDDRFLQTLLITTAYFSGKVVPAFAMFYDWQGPLLMQPGFTYIRDPFRFIFDYTYITGPPTAQIGAVRDRPPAERFDGEDRIVRLGAGAVIMDDDVRTLLREPQRERATHTLRRAGDERDRSLDLHGHRT